MEDTQPEPITPPHGERSNDPTLNAEWIVAEAMSLDLSRGMGRIKYSAGASHAVRSLLAAGWTPPSATGEGDEAARLREQLAVMQAHVDETNAHMRRTHDSEQAMEIGRRQMSSAALVNSQNLRAAAAEAGFKGEPEPTMKYSDVAAGLEKLIRIGNGAEKREKDRQAKARVSAVGGVR